MATIPPPGPARTPTGDEEVAPCPLGCRPDDEVVLEGIDHLHGLPGRFTVVSCRACGLMRTSPRPTLEAIGAYYPDPYGPYQGTPARAGGGNGWGTRLLRRWRLDGTRSLVPPMPPGRALEIGCATGSFLRKIRARGWEVQGIEPSASAAAIARQQGLEVHVGPVETAPPPASKYDLVTASHTVEHLHRPLEVFSRLHEWTRGGGWLTCALPDASSFVFRKFRQHWYDLDLPRHLYHFTPASFTRVLRQTGWEVKRIAGQSTLNGFAGSIGYRLRERSGADSRLARVFLQFPESNGVLKNALAPLSWLLKAMRETGRIVVWARRL
jgi:SAM-dependent methyltransferase